MVYKIKKKKEKTMIKFQIGKDVIYAKNKRELNKKLKKDIILWHFQ